MRYLLVALLVCVLCVVPASTRISSQIPLYVRLATGECVQARFKVDAVLEHMYTDHDGSHIALVTIEGYTPQEVDPDLADVIESFVVIPGAQEDTPEAVFQLRLFMVAPGSEPYTIEAYGVLAAVLHTAPHFQPPVDGTTASLVLM